MRLAVLLSWMLASLFAIVTCKSVSFENISPAETFALAAVLRGDLDAMYAYFQRGVSPNLRVDGYALIHYAAMKGRREVVRELIQNCGVSPLTKTSDGRTAMHFAAEKGHVPVARTLEFNGDCCEVQAKDGKTPLHVAVINGQLDMVKWLVATKRPDFDIVTEEGHTVFDLVEMYPHRDIKKVLLKAERS